MLIDWFTVGAQIFNFLILMVLLKLFLYDRIIGVVDDREERLENTRREAERKKEEAEKEAESYRRKREEFETQKKGLLKEARDEAEKRRKELVADARQEVDRQREKWKESLQREKDALVRQLREQTAVQVYETCRKAVRDMADEALEGRILEQFLSGLQDVDEESRERLKEAASQNDGRMVLRSAFHLDEDANEKVLSGIRQIFGEKLNLEYQQAPELILGIEMGAGGEWIGWNMESYLNAVEEAAMQTIRSGDAGESQAK